MLFLMSAWALDGCDWIPKLLDTTLAAPTDPEWKGKTVMVVRKNARRVQLFRDQQPVLLPTGEPACWRVGLAWDYPEGSKQVRGDRKTPEGWFSTSDRPWSAYYGAITIHYPAIRDAERGLRDALIDRSEHDRILSSHRKGVLPPMETRLGGRILLHGGGSGSDWTLGCVALENEHIDAMRSLLPRGMRTNVLVLP